MENRSSDGAPRLIAALCAAALIASLPGPVRAQAPDRARTEALAKRAGERLVALQREADRLASQETTLLNELRKLEIDRQLKAAHLKEAADEAASIEAEIERTTERIDALDASAAAERPELNSRLVEMYKMGRAR